MKKSTIYILLLFLFSCGTENLLSMRKRRRLNSQEVAATTQIPTFHGIFCVLCGITVPADVLTEVLKYFQNFSALQLCPVNSDWTDAVLYYLHCDARALEPGRTITLDATMNMVVSKRGKPERTNFDHMRAFLNHDPSFYKGNVQFYVLDGLLCDYLGVVLLHPEKVTGLVFDICRTKRVSMRDGYTQLITMISEEHVRDSLKAFSHVTKLAWSGNSQHSYLSNRPFKELIAKICDLEHLQEICVCNQILYAGSFNEICCHRGWTSITLPRVSERKKLSGSLRKLIDGSAESLEVFCVSAYWDSNLHLLGQLTKLKELRLCLPSKTDDLQDDLLNSLPCCTTLFLETPSSTWRPFNANLGRIGSQLTKLTLKGRVRLTTGSSLHNFARCLKKLKELILINTRIISSPGRHHCACWDDEIDFIKRLSILKMLVLDFDESEKSFYFLDNLSKPLDSSNPQEVLLSHLENLSLTDQSVFSQEDVDRYFPTLFVKIRSLSRIASLRPPDQYGFFQPSGSYHRSDFSEEE